jgi:hypothetical protein
MLCKLLLVAISLACLPSDQGKPDKLFVATTNATKPIGNIVWVITEDKSGKALGKGNKKLLLKDVTVVRRDDGYLTARIKLSNGFMLTLPLDTDNELGFGLTADHDSEDVFSWEWFSVEGPGKAIKLQETGELAFATNKAGYISKMSFLTPISIRIKRAIDDVSAGERWRINISKGSTITWPSFINGKVVPN